MSVKVKRYQLILAVRVRSGECTGKGRCTRIVRNRSWGLCTRDFIRSCGIMTMVWLTLVQGHG